MLRFIKLVILAAIAILLVVLAFANRDSVTLKPLPDEMAAWAGVPNPPIELPLYMVILAGVAIGLLIGYIAEWLREHRQRSQARTERRARVRLEREVETLKGQTGQDKDDVLALLEDSRRAG